MKRVERRDNVEQKEMRLSKVLERLRLAPQPLSASTPSAFAGRKSNLGLSEGHSKTANTKEGGKGRKQAKKRIKVIPKHHLCTCV